MQKLAERLIEKNLSKVIAEITLDICERYFDVCFKEACDSPNPKDTTLGTCYRKLEALSIKTAAIRLDALLYEVTNEIGLMSCSSTNNPFAKIAFGLWDEFLYYYDIKGYVENVIGDEWHEKQEKLFREGILNEHGDYIKGGILE